LHDQHLHIFISKKCISESVLLLEINHNR